MCVFFTLSALCGIHKLQKFYTASDLTDLFHNIRLISFIHAVDLTIKLFV